MAELKKIKVIDIKAGHLLQWEKGKHYWTEDRKKLLGLVIKKEKNNNMIDFTVRLSRKSKDGKREIFFSTPNRNNSSFFSGYRICLNN